MSMKQSLLVCLFFCSLVGIGLYTVMLLGSDMLSSAPQQTAQFKEIFVSYNQDIEQHFNKLSEAEKTFIALMYQASIPGNRILMDQVHRHGPEVFDLFKTLYDQQGKLTQLEKSGSVIFEQSSCEEFIDQVKTYLVYLFVNNGQYFKRESENEKRTPNKLELAALTKENLCRAFEALGLVDKADRVQVLERTIFDHTYEPTLTVAGSIEKSAVNIYAKSDHANDPQSFTQADFDALDDQDFNNGACYYDVQVTKDKKRVARVTPYAVNGKYGKELEIMVSWLRKAHDVVIKHPEYFDQHLVTSLEHLITSLETGSQAEYALHCIAWLKDKSRVSYTLGFVESYFDPMGDVASFQSDVTIQDPDFDLTHLSKQLPALEAALPLPQEFKRNVLGSDAALPNATMRIVAAATGDLGPLFLTAAYCLPNDAVIRSEHGTKQIIYRADKGLAATINPVLTRKLFYLKKRAEWFEKHDQDFSIMTDLWNIHVVLHETLGHGSGKYAEHTFQDGEELKINGVKHKVGDRVLVTNANFSKFMAGTDAAIEELRAEIIALYISLNHLDVMKEHGLLKKWPQKLSDDQLREWLVFDMANTALRRIVSQNSDATEVTGAHAQANCIITNFLIERGGIAWQLERVDVNGVSYDVLGIEIINLTKAMDAVKELMVLTQTIKSTANGIKARWLIDTYGKPLNQDYFKILKANEKMIVDDLKERVVLNPHFVPELQENGSYKLVASWPRDIFDLIEKWV